jgi:hypothetical protein
VIPNEGGSLRIANMSLRVPGDRVRDAEHRKRGRPPDDPIPAAHPTPSAVSANFVARVMSLVYVRCDSDQTVEPQPRLKIAPSATHLTSASLPNICKLRAVYCPDNAATRSAVSDVLVSAGWQKADRERMVIAQIGAAIKMARFTARVRKGGIWLAIRVFIEGRNAVAVERERRTTLLMVPAMQQPGTEIYDRRSDGSVLRIRIPANQVVVYAAAVQSGPVTREMSCDQDATAQGIEK